MTYPFNSIPTNNPQNFQLATPVGLQSAARDPTAQDDTFIPGTEWQNTITGRFWKCFSSTIAGAVWRTFSPNIGTLTGNTGGPVGPNNVGNIDVVGDGTTITITGSPGTNTLTASLVGGTTAIDSFIPDFGTSPVVPTVTGQVTMTGSGVVSTLGGLNTLTTQIVSVATAGTPIVSQGAGDAAFGTATVPGGGTGSTSFADNNSLVTTGASGTSPLVSLTSGAVGTFLQSAGPGVTPLWAFPTAGFTMIVSQVFLANGTYTPTVGMQYCIVECVGGGGGAGGVDSGGGGGQSVSGGGGSGGYARRVLSAASIGLSQPVMIGSAGAGGTPGVAGGNGGPTSLGALVIANGGFGSTAASLRQADLGGAGATTVGEVGDFVGGGNSGGTGTTNTVVGGGSIRWSAGGFGAPSVFGGAPQNALQYSVVGGAPGSSATSYGAGGSGGALISSVGGQDVSGGSGYAGIVIVTEYI